MNQMNITTKHEIKQCLTRRRKTQRRTQTNKLQTTQKKKFDISEKHLFILKKGKKEKMKMPVN